MNILVLGARGMAGHVVSFYLKEKGYQVDTLSPEEKLDNDTIILDVLKLDKFTKLLSKKKYDIIINCIGILVKQSDARNDLAIYLNAYLPKFLEYYYKNSLTKVIHISSDGVFSGKQTSYYEKSVCDSDSFYGKTKSLGEIDNNKDLTFRTSIIGPELMNEGKSLINWLFQQNDCVMGYMNARWKGVTTIELARAISDAIEQNITGIYHLVSDKSISKFQLIKTINNEFKLGLNVNPCDGATLNTNLINARIDFKHTIPNIKKMVKDMKEWMNKYPDLYAHYEK